MLIDGAQLAVTSLLNVVVTFGKQRLTKGNNSVSRNVEASHQQFDTFDKSSS